LDRASPSPSITSFSAVAHIIEIVERLAHAHHHDVGQQRPVGRIAAFVLVFVKPVHRALGPFAQRVARQHDLADDLTPAVRLRTSRMVPVWQNRQLSVQPTWLETHSVPRSASGMKTIS
jgi:hypothetical protein